MQLPYKEYGPDTGNNILSHVQKKKIRPLKKPVGGPK